MGSRNRDSQYNLLVLLDSLLIEITMLFLHLPAFIEAIQFWGCSEFPALDS
jgi:hypothetical protein